ncbi:MAG: hypothetical protein Q4G33_07905 [bacterium]|nr:hypothetical protein [bacterium]
MGFGKKPKPDDLLTAVLNDTVSGIDQIQKDMRAAEEELKKNRDILKSRLNGEDKSEVHTGKNDNYVRRPDERSSGPSVLQKLHLYKQKSAKQKNQNRNLNKTRKNEPEL